ncbi:Helicase conserved C-terminal domain-containing protein [Nocardioides exalbidus]|uniref:Helicase conserved C-terminal domain-containing protein n=2 Tax=Nocardioides exalbidus TaxID=402596 RepID=A0A1H4KQP8_9ACTN|nr:Helicase conserved C-terminal domain-containing protein [Nocardioides exalbidus]
MSAWYDARRMMVEALVADLQGTHDHELIDEAPLRRFLVGVLYPRGTSAEPQPDSTLGDDTDQDAGTEVDATYDPGVSFAHTRRPSTIGLTTSVSAVTPVINVTVQADRYERVSEESASNSWSRVPFGPVEVDLTLAVTGSGQSVLGQGLVLRYVIRPVKDGRRSVTVVLLNDLSEPLQGAPDGACWFRPSLTVRTPDGEFVDRRPSPSVEFMDDDEMSSALLHRRQRNLAVGHGVAVEWEEGLVVRQLTTTFFPQHDLPLADASRADVPSLDMQMLASGDRTLLYALVETYEAWIHDRSIIDLESLDGAHLDTAGRHLREAEAAARRMRRGISLLESDAMVARAFAAMNETMRSQRQRQEVLRTGSDRHIDAVVAAWRPFQMAFILMNIEGVVNPASNDREIADVLWFPTGGGKTEAYLGLISLTLVLRRLRGTGSDGQGGGVGVLMRYTLRLLTLQQFERAAGLVCALEVWRAGQPDLSSKSPFTIGLWVGQGATPNNVRDAGKALRDRARGLTPENGDPVQLLRCPWCGSRLSEVAYVADRAADELRVECPGTTCPFAAGLPVALVDTDVYAKRPSLVIGTVDKFAMLAWNADSNSIFGGGTDAPPELVIQDELHLISGPLGTLVGLYETAVDRLATDPHTGAGPKVVASTATIRRSAQQVRAVFNRESRQFPPPGIEAGDSFFAVDASSATKGTRQYVGVMAPGASHATLTVRAYAALLQAGAGMEVPDEVRDAYWTLLGYFGSLRVLGAAYIATIDDVRDRIKVVASRLGQSERKTRDPRELTSRKKASEIPVELDALQTPYPSPESPDTVLATNMISVGLDVDRLGLMVVSGQPQTTSEYIQATSRVGRRHPGLVITLFNAGRSRDLSHFESFTTYHRSIYQQVEATGATPFAPRALDRGLHGVVVVLLRHLLTGARPDSAAGMVDEVSRSDLDDALACVLERVRSIAPEQEDEVLQAVDALVDHWRDAVADGYVSKYAGWRSPDAALMVPAGAQMQGADNEPLVEVFPPSRPAWPTLTSLRNVDSESTLRLVNVKREARTP